jgi:hypothetical protein
MTPFFEHGPCLPVSLSQFTLSTYSRIVASAEQAKKVPDTWVHKAIMNQAPASAPPFPERERSSAVGKNCIAGVKGRRGVGERTVNEQ